jgi:hypothetical protein
MMVKWPTLLMAAGLQIFGLHAVSNASPQGCACNCTPDTAVFRVWQRKDGPADRFAANAIRSWFDRMGADETLRTNGTSEAFSKTELLILLGRSTQGIWSVETQYTDAGGEVYTDLVCTTIEGKRKVVSVIKGDEVNSSSLASLVLRRLRRLAKNGRWHPDSVIPVRLPLQTKPPSLVLRETGKPDDEAYAWRLNVRTRDGRIVRIKTKRAGFVDFFRGAKCFGGVIDDANGETWWILVKTAAIDNCSSEWRSIRFSH